jgi:hypothetical protein
MTVHAARGADLNALAAAYFARHPEHAAPGKARAVAYVLMGAEADDALADATQSAPYADVAGVQSDLLDLGANLAEWRTRDGERDASSRRAASEAVALIDAMVSALHGIRAGLITEIRASDDSPMACAGSLPGGAR